MDLLGKIVWVLMVVWTAAMAIGLLLALMPLLLFVAAFVGTVYLLGLFGRLLARWLGY